jgi:FkbM family methyltransferase
MLGSAEYRSLGFTRRYGALVQSRLPDGVILQPFDNMPSINKEIYLWRVYTKFRELREGDAVVDVGAHVAVFTLMASRRARRVVAIEPHPFNYKLLLKNIALNKLTNVTPVNVALSNYCGNAKLYIAKNSGAHTIEEEMVDRYKIKHHFDVDKYVEVKVKTLDSLADELELDEVTFIKVDPEGSELNVLKEAERTLKENDAFLFNSRLPRSKQAARDLQLPEEHRIRGVYSSLRRVSRDICLRLKKIGGA